MSKQAATPVVSTQARSAIVHSFVQALNANESTGSLVTQVCDTANKYLKGEVIPDDERKLITQDIARERGWKGASLKSRMSECNVILKAYAVLPDAIAAYKDKAKSCQWHNSMRLARRLNAGDSVAQAVRAAFTQTQKAPVPIAGRVAGALQAWLREAKPDKRAAILKAAQLMGIKLKTVSE